MTKSKKIKKIRRGSKKEIHILSGVSNIATHQNFTKFLNNLIFLKIEKEKTLVN